ILTLSATMPRRNSHSFPTRRSSDLLLLPPSIPGKIWICWLKHVMLIVTGLPDHLRPRYGNSPREPLVAGPTTKSNRRDLFYSPRSEEHTSELQSRENLVCRLLIEKK